MKSFLRIHRIFIFFFLGFIIVECLAKPLGNFPTNDDWAYAQTVKRFNDTGEINFGGFPAMSLYTHVLWGWLFTKLFGFTMFTLRFSTLISALIGFIFLNKLVVQINGSRLAGVVTCVVLLCNPIFFYLSNTYMTDVNFNTLCIISFFSIYNYFITKRIIFYGGFILAASALILVRQYGIIFPVCFIIAALFSNEGRWRTLVLAFLSMIIVVAVLKIYEDYLKNHLPKDGAYRFSGSVDITDLAFWKGTIGSFKLKYKEISQLTFFYLGPIALLFLSGVIKNVHKISLICSGIISVVVTYIIFTGEYVTSANIFSNMMLGPETFYENFNGARHNVYPRFDTIIFVVKIGLSFVTLFVISASLISRFSNVGKGVKCKPESALLISLILAYVFMLLITETFFDRYHLPLITFGLIGFSWMVNKYDLSIQSALLPIMFLLWITISGTRDYFEWNRQRWSAYWYLNNEKKVDMNKINGGFEVNCWANGEGSGWRDFLTTEKFDYLIQFNCPSGFKPIKEYEFQRYFPYKKDKIYIFVRENLP